MNKFELDKLNMIDDNFITHSFIEQNKNIIKKCKFHEYDVFVELDEFNKFRGICEIKISRDFLKTEHRSVSKINIEDLYED